MKIICLGRTLRKTLDVRWQLSFEFTIQVFDAIIHCKVFILLICCEQQQKISVLWYRFTRVWLVNSLTKFVIYLKRAGQFPSSLVCKLQKHNQTCHRWNHMSIYTFLAITFPQNFIQLSKTQIKLDPRTMLFAFFQILERSEADFLIS